MHLYFSLPFVDVDGSDMTALRFNFNYIAMSSSHFMSLKAYANVAFLLWVRSRHAAVDKPPAMYPKIPSSIPGFSSLSVETLAVALSLYDLSCWWTFNSNSLTHIL